MNTLRKFRHRRIRVVIIIPHLYTGNLEHLVNCVRSLQTSAKLCPQIEIKFLIFVNGIKDTNNLKLIRHFLKNKKSLEPLSSYLNIGFTGAVNQSLEYAIYAYNPDWYLILNDDTLVKKSFFGNFKSQLHQFQASILSCQVENMQGIFESNGLYYQRSGLAFPNKDIERPNIDYFCGTCFFVSKACVSFFLLKYGYLLHPLYFAYAEDLELSIRCKTHNQLIYVLPQIEVTHIGSQTAKRGSSYQLYLSNRNWLMTVFLHWSLTRIKKNFIFIILGQLYILIIFFKYRYLKPYIKSLYYIIKHYKIISSMREQYAKVQ